MYILHTKWAQIKKNNVEIHEDMFKTSLRSLGCMDGVADGTSFCQPLDIN